MELLHTETVPTPTRLHIRCLANAQVTLCVVLACFGLLDFISDVCLFHLVVLTALEAGAEILQKEQKQKQTGELNAIWNPSSKMPHRGLGSSESTAASCFQ